MVILDESPPAKLPRELQHFRERDIRWVWWWLIGRGYELPHESSLQPSERIRRLTNGLTLNPSPPDLIARVLQAHKDELVSEDALEWIDKGDQRFLMWLMICEGMNLHSPAEPGQSTLFGGMKVPPEQRRAEFIFRLDMAKMPLAEKYALLNRIRSNWSVVRTHDRQTKWLNRKSTAQITWAWDYLCNHNKTTSIAPPATDEERYISVLVALDLYAVFNSAEKQLFIEKMKKTWSQKKYRDSGKAKKPYNLPLTVRANEQLDWLAKMTGKNRSDVLIHLIEEECRRSKGFTPQLPEGVASGQ